MSGRHSICGRKLAWHLEAYVGRDPRSRSPTAPEQGSSLKSGGRTASAGRLASASGEKSVSEMTCVQGAPDLGLREV